MHGLVDRNGHLEQDVVVDSFELRVRAHADFDQSVARLAGAEPARALALQAQDLTVADTGRHVEVERTAAGQRHALGRTLDGLEEIDVERVAHIVSLDGEAGAGPGATGAEHVGEDVAEAELVKAGAGTGPGAPRIGAKTVAARLAARVDLAAIKSAAFVRIAENLVGRRYLLEALVAAGRVDIRVQLLGKLTKSPANVVVRGVSGHAKGRVRVIGHGGWVLVVAEASI